MTEHMLFHQASGRQAVPKKLSTQVRTWYAGSLSARETGNWTPPVACKHRALCKHVHALIAFVTARYTPAAGLQALHDGDLRAAQRQVDALEPSQYQGRWYGELRLRLLLAEWDKTSGNKAQRKHLLEELRLAADVDFDEFEVHTATGSSFTHWNVAVRHPQLHA